jgi:hypothetical protein
MKRLTAGQLNKYYGLDTSSGDMRLVYLGKFNGIGEAVDKADKLNREIVWVLEDKDVKLILDDYNRINKRMSDI